MKNSQIHSGLDKREIRDFLSKSIIQNFEAEKYNKKIHVPYTSDNSFEWAIKDAENDIEYHKKRLDLLKQKLGIINLIKMNGWKEFDVSDETSKDLQYTLKMNFIGTDEEYNKFMSSIENEVSREK